MHNAAFCGEYITEESVSDLNTDRQSSDDMAMANTTDLSFSFPCGLRGYHEYRAIWTPALHKILPTIHESPMIVMP